MDKNPTLKKRVIKNASWIIAAKVIQAIIGLVISMLTARFLGPANFGIINYASSIMAFAVPIMGLGFSNVLVQEFTNNPEDEGKIIGTAVALCFISSLFCIAGIALYTFIVDFNERTTNLVVLLYSLSLIAQAVELIQYWFQAKLLSKYISIASLVVYLIVASYRVVLLILKAPVILFAISSALDYLLIAILLFVTYKKKSDKKISFSKEIGKRLFHKSKHYIFSSLMVVIFSQTDKVMIKLMINEEAVGYYSAAVSCAGMTSFVFAAIIDSFRPVIFQHKKENNVLGYELNLKRLYCIVIYLAFAQSLVMTFFSKLIIYILYGEQYHNSILALQIIVWYTTFAYVGSIRNVWVLGENKQKYLWIINLTAALMNVLLNFFFIQLWGIYGAAIASLITQIFANVVMNIIVWPFHHSLFLMLKGLNPKLIIGLFRKDTSLNDSRRN